MGDKTGIEWTDHTFNPWWGCVRVLPACEHCYAETFAARFGVKWGVKAERKPASEKYWRKPEQWNAAAEKAGKRARVFCASMADVFEDRRDLDVHRERLFALIEATPWLDWQLLTKRPEAIMRLVPERWRGGLPNNVWVGTTVEDQRRAEERIPCLLAIPARVRFLSCEPLLDDVDLDLGRCDTHNRTAVQFTPNDGWFCNECAASGYSGELSFGHWLGDPDNGIHWVIAGGESGNGARVMSIQWARKLRDQCAADGVPFFFKQWGEWAPQGTTGGAARDSVSITHVGDEWAEMWRVGKKLAGSLLDGVEHKAFPS